MAKLIDIDPLETGEWLDSLHAVLQQPSIRIRLFLNRSAWQPKFLNECALIYRR
jgi:pyruvate dehydrogenase complex dehydrogenase (E1) component